MNFDMIVEDLEEVAPKHPTGGGGCALIWSGAQ